MGYARTLATNARNVAPAGTPQVFTASGTYTPTAGMKHCIIECIDGGGGGRATVTSSAAGVAATGYGAGDCGYRDHCGV